MENGQKIVTRVMIMPDDLGDQVEHVCMLLFSGYQSSEEAHSLLLPIVCSLNRLQTLCFCQLRFIENMINQISCSVFQIIHGWWGIPNNWVNLQRGESMVIKKWCFYWDIQIYKHFAKRRSLQGLHILLPGMLKTSSVFL